MTCAPERLRREFWNFTGYFASIRKVDLHDIAKPLSLLALSPTAQKKQAGRYPLLGRACLLSFSWIDFKANSKMTRPLPPRRGIGATMSASIVKPERKESECAANNSKAPSRSQSGLARWFSRGPRPPTQQRLEKDAASASLATNEKSKKSLSFLRLAKERRFDEIIAVLKQLSNNSSATEAWLTLANNDKFHVVSSCESLHALCMYRPTVAVVQAVMEALSRIHNNNVDVTVMVDAAGRTPLHICAAFGACVQVTELLMKDSTAVLTPDHARRYPLHWACAHPHGGQKLNKKSTDNMVEVISKLIEAYAVAVISQDKNGHSPLDLAGAALADERILSALRFVIKILPSNGLFDHTASIETESVHEVPQVAVCDDDDDLSSVGSRGVSRHVRRYMSVDQKVPSLVIL
jgi:hypothetical protein